MRGRLAIGAVVIAAATLGVHGLAGREGFPEIFLNHAFRVVDGESWRAMKDSRFLRTELASFEERTTRATDGDSWTGMYFYGERTYFEVLEAKKDSWQKEGMSAIAFGVDVENRRTDIANALGKISGEKVEPVLRERVTEGGSVPWFYLVTAAFRPPMPDFATFVMEYHPDFLAKWYPEVEPSVSGVSRSSVLTRYRAKAAAKFPVKDPLLKDVTGITLALGPAEAEALGRELAAFRFDRSREGDDTVWNGPELRVRVVPASAAGSGVRQLDLSLKRKTAAERRETFGRARLNLRTDGTGTLSFF